MKKILFTLLISTLPMLAVAAQPKEIATEEQIERAYQHRMCGFEVRRAVRDQKYELMKEDAFQYAKIIKAPYSKKDLDDIIWHCERRFANKY